MQYGALRKERIDQGFSQYQLAQLLGLCSRNAYALKERGQRRFSIDEGLLIAHLLGRSVEELFSRPEVNDMVTKED